MKKRLLLIVTFFLLAVLPANALINITDMEKYYAIGDEISASVKIVSDMDVQALLTAKLLCEEYEVTYFIHPLDLKEDKKTAIEIPPLKTSDRMIGTCVVDFYINSLIGAEIEKKWTDSFEVTKEKIVEEEIEEPEIINISGKETEEAAADDTKEENIYKAWLYFIVPVMIIIVLFFYLKFKFSNKNRFNKGWKL